MKLNIKEKTLIIIVLVTHIISLLACQSLPQNISKIESEEKTDEIIQTEDTGKTTVSEKINEVDINRPDYSEESQDHLDSFEEPEINYSLQSDNFSVERFPESTSNESGIKFSVYSEAVPENALNYANNIWDNQIPYQLCVYDRNQIPYDTRDPVTMGHGFYMYLWDGENLTNSSTVFFPAIQNNYILCFLAVMPLNEVDNMWTSSTNNDLTAVINEHSFENGLIVYDDQGNAYYISDRVYLLQKSSTYFSNESDLTEDYKNSKKVLTAVREMIMTGEVSLQEIKTK